MSVWRCSVTADPRYSSCSVWDAATLGASISSTAFTYSSCCHVKWRGRVACLFHTFSISSTVCFTCSAVWEPPNWCTYGTLYLKSERNVMWCRDGRTHWGFKNSRWRRKPWCSTKEKSWLSRDSFNDLLCNIRGHVAVSRIFLWTFESIRECLLLQCLCLYFLSGLVVFFERLFFICHIKCVVLNAAPRNGHIADVTCRCWTTFAF